MKRTRAFRSLVTAVALFAGLAAGVLGATIAIGNVSDEPQAPDGPAVTHWLTNASGHTYGSGLGVRSAADMPDLIRAGAMNGKVGYVLLTDLEGPMPSSPEEALAWQAAQAGKDKIIPVYESDGVTQIGVFLVSQRGDGATVFKDGGSPTPSE